MDPGIKNQRWKIKALEEQILASAIHVPFFVLTETHLKSYHLDAEVLIKNYTTIRADREKRARGGAAVYLHNDVVPDVIEVYSNAYCEIAMVYNQATNIIISGMYRPPLAPFELFDECLTKLQDFINSVQSTPEIFVAGDFNFPFVDWILGEIPTGSSILLSDRKSATALFHFMDENFLQQLVTEPTRKDRNILDLVLSNNTDMIHSVTVQKTEKSDHDLVSCTLLHPEFLPHPAERPPYTPETPLDDINFAAADWDSIRKALDNVNWCPITDQTIDQDTAWDMFEKTVVDVCQRFAPCHSKSSRGSSAYSSIPKSRRALLRKKKRLNSRINCLKYTDSSPLDSKTVKLQKLNDERASIELQIKVDIKQERIREEQNAISKIKVNPKAFYSFAKKSAKYKSSVGPLLDENDQLQSDPIIMGTILQSQYEMVFSNPDNVDPSAEIKMDHILPNGVGLYDTLFSQEDVTKAINKLDKCSAAGPDKFPALILKECQNQLAPVISDLWRISFDTGQIADKFKSQSVIPVFKKGSKAVAANYRPVSLTSHLIKVFERVLCSKVVEYIEANNLINPNQHGFRSGHSCLTQLLNHVDDVMNDLSSDVNADVMYLDFSKAFDKVDHRILLKKLHLYGIRGKAYEWISSFLSGRKQHVVVDGVRSPAIDVVSGVPQGTVLGPLLFILYINDIFNSVKHSIIKVFADDSKVHKYIKSLFDRTLLQEDIEAIVKWATENNMELNPSKFQLLQHGKNEDLKLPYTLPSGESLFGEDCVKDLGVYVDHRLSWKSHINTKAAEASKKASWILRTFSCRDKDTMMLLYKSYVRSIVEYCCPLWSPHQQCDIIKIESVQRSFTARINGMRFMDYWERLKALKLYSLQRRRERYSIILIWKIQFNLIPNCINITFNESVRRGTTCIRPLGSSRYSSINTMIFNSFSSVAPALYNVVPANIKSITTLTRFKAALDKWLKSFPDTPPTPGYLGANKNSLLEWMGSKCQ